MNVFADSTQEKSSDNEKLQLLTLIKEWLQAEYDDYRYGAEAIVMLSDDTAIFMETPNELAKFDFDTIKFGSDDGILKVNFDDEGTYVFGFLTESKLNKYSGDVVLPISMTDDDKLVKELHKTQGVKITPLKCDTMDEFLERIKDNQ